MTNGVGQRITRIEANFLQFRDWFQFASFVGPSGVFRHSSFPPRMLDCGMPTDPQTAALTRFAEAHLAETLEFLREMVGINSFTQNPAGIDRLAACVAAHFAPLGFRATHVKAADPRHGSHLVLERLAAVGAPTIALVSHLDTVFTEEEERRNEFHWRVEGTRIHGPGTNDIKGGTALLHLMLAALQQHAPSSFAQTNWVVLLNACEEVISADFGHVVHQHVPADARACLVFEADGGDREEFPLVTARKGRPTFQVTVAGRGAHAGGSHRRGANAIVQLAHVVSDVAQLTD